MIWMLLFQNPWSFCWCVIFYTCYSYLNNLDRLVDGKFPKNLGKQFSVETENWRLIWNLLDKKIIIKTQNKVDKNQRKFKKIV